jgi:hypothetical protein
MVRNVPAQLNSLPTFTYTKAAQNAVAHHSGRAKQPIPTGQRTNHKSVSWHQGNKDYVRQVTENMISLTRWADEEAPEDWPANLQYPQDLLKAPIYAAMIEESNGARRSERGEQLQNPDYEVWGDLVRCLACNQETTRVSQLCNCTATAWDDKNTIAWQTANISLRMEDETRGVGTYALKPLKAHDVVGEYVGELVPADDPDSKYIFGIENYAKENVMHIDSLRLGNWTRFINHSCAPNTGFELVRVGTGIRVVVRVLKSITSGEEITVDYGDRYWEQFKARGLWCVCGEKACKHYEGSKKKKEEDCDCEGFEGAENEGEIGIWNIIVQYNISAFERFECRL